MLNYLTALLGKAPVRIHLNTSFLTNKLHEGDVLFKYMSSLFYSKGEKTKTWTSVGLWEHFLLRTGVESSVVWWREGEWIRAQLLEWCESVCVCVCDLQRTWRPQSRQHFEHVYSTAHLQACLYDRSLRGGLLLAVFDGMIPNCFFQISSIIFYYILCGNIVCVYTNICIHLLLSRQLNFQQPLRYFCCWKFCNYRNNLHFKINSNMKTFFKK